MQDPMMVPDEGAHLVLLVPVQIEHTVLTGVALFEAEAVLAVAAVALMAVVLMGV